MTMPAAPPPTVGVGARLKNRMQQLTLRTRLGVGVYGGFGIGSYGSPLGQVTGINDHDADDMPTMGPQFAGGGGPVSAPAGGSGSSGGAAPAAGPGGA